MLWGLSLARQSGIEVDRNVLKRAYRFLNKELVEAEEQHDLQAWMLHALSAYHTTAKLKRVDKFQSKAFGNLWKNKSRLNAYTRSLLALAAHHYGDKKRAMILIENLENGVIIDKTPGYFHHPARLEKIPTGSDGHGALGRRWYLLSVVQRRSGGHGICPARPAHHRSQKQTGETGHELADQEPSRRQLE